MKKNDGLITQAELKELLAYDERTGLFTRQGGARTGRTAGAKNQHGYVQIYVKGRFFTAQRLAWLYVHGVWPKDEIDHINHQRDDNRISNLRDVPKMENAKNLRLHKNNVSGAPGVRWNKRQQKWVAKIKVARRDYHIGVFDNCEDAVAARRRAEADHGFHANHGRVR